MPFFSSGEGKGSPRCQRGGGGRFFIEIPRGGGSPRGGKGGGGKGREGVCRT